MESKKYYDLIISLIKNHKKYPGCESIIDEIAEDVYEHAKIVLSTVTNEDVITAYLDKVISTSIITVPKKLNINRRPSTPAFVLTPRKQEEPELVEELEEAFFAEEPVEEPLVEEPVLEIEDEPLVEEVVEEPALEIEDEPLVEEVVEEPVLEIEDEEELENDLEEFIIEETEPLAELEEEPIVEKLESTEVNTVYVDNMINGIPEETIEEVEDNNEEFNPPNYTCFSFNPDEIETIDYSDEICSSLNELDSKHPELKIIDICRLKFNENLSIKEIAKNLNVEESFVLESLNEIIDTVKD